eukprot:COSAG01_NODE_4141_length_5297_cov_78.284973_2_plen_318_part_00
MHVTTFADGFGKMRKEYSKSAFTGEVSFGLGTAEGDKGDAPIDKTSFCQERPFPFVDNISPKLYDVVHSSPFEYAVLAMIVANATAMASEYHEMRQWHHDLLHGLEATFLIFFTVEMLLKWLGMGMKYYFADRFNCFDCSLVVFGLLGVMLDAIVGGSSSGRVLRILFRMFRVARLLRLAGKESTVAVLIKTIFSSWSAIGNLMLFISFTLVVFAIIGMHTFGFTCHGDNMLHTPVPRTNFASFSDAILACFQVMSGEDWAPIMYFYMHCSNPLGVSIYFVTLVTFTGFVCASLFFWFCKRAYSCMHVPYIDCDSME